MTIQPANPRTGPTSGHPLATFPMSAPRKAPRAHWQTAFAWSTKVDQRFQARSDLAPQTLSDCLHELTYWNSLYWLRGASHKDAMDHLAEVNSRTDFVFRSLAKIRARTKEEAIAVFRYLADDDNMEREEANEILLNLLG